MKPFELVNISKYRKELMGISALLILVCHTIAYVDMPLIFHYILSFGNIGVDLFFLLSGVGIYYSLYNNKKNTYRWYAYRFKKLMIPYLIITILFVAIKLYLGLFSSTEIGFIIRYVLTIQFWLSHQGAWFVAAIIPMYLLAPILYKHIRKNSFIAILFILICYIVDIIPLQYFDNKKIVDILNNIQFASIRVNCFILGMWIAKKIEQKQNLSIFKLLILIIAGIIAMIITKHMVYCYFFFCLPLLYLLCLIVEYVGKIVNNVFIFFGDITLESYLFNGNLPILIITLFQSIDLNDSNNVLAYLISVILGTFLSYLFHLINIKIIG